MVLLDPDLSDLVALLTKLGTRGPVLLPQRVLSYLHALVTFSHS